MLSTALRSLETDGLVHRKVYPEVPPRVEYYVSFHAMMRIRKKRITFVVDQRIDMYQYRIAAGLLHALL